MAINDVARSQYKQVLHNTSYHRPDPAVMERMERLREAAKAFAEVVNNETFNVDMPRERAMAYTAIEEALQSAIGGLARHT